MYEEVREYLSHSQYPEGASKRDRGIIRKRSKNFQVNKGILWHKKKTKDGVLLRKVVEEENEKYQIFQSYHIVNDSHNGCNRTAKGISSKYYWIPIYSEVKYLIQQCEVCQSNRKLNKPAPVLPPLSITEASCKSEGKQSIDEFNNDDHDDASKLHEEMVEKCLYFPVEATCKKGVSSEMVRRFTKILFLLPIFVPWNDSNLLQQPLSKHHHFPNLVSEAIEEESSGEVPQFDRDLSNQESKPPSYEVLDPEKREPALNQLSHQDIATPFNSDVLSRREIPPSEEYMLETASFQPENKDEGQFVVGLSSPADSLASRSQRLRELQISEKTHGPFTPQTPTTPIVPSQKPQTAQVMDNSELIASYQIVPIKELPSPCSEYGSLTMPPSVEEALQGFEGDQRSDPLDNSREVFCNLLRVRPDYSQPSAALVQPNHSHGRGSGVISPQRPAQSTFPGDCPPNQPWSSQPQNHGNHYPNPDQYTYLPVGGVSSHVPNFREMSPHPSWYHEPNKVPRPPPNQLHGVPPPQSRHHGGSEYGSLTMPPSVEEALQRFEGDQHSDPLDNSREVLQSPSGTTGLFSALGSTSPTKPSSWQRIGCNIPSTAGTVL